MLIDQFLPEFDFSERHDTDVTADPRLVYRAILEVDLLDSWIIQFLFRLRGLPIARPMRLAAFSAFGFVPLGEEPDFEMVLGVVGRFWRARGDLQKVSPEGFIAFAEPGYAKAAWNFRVEPAPGGTLASTETRIRTTDVTAQRSFRRYWLVIRPFSALIRKRLLTLIKRQAERSP